MCERHGVARSGSAFSGCHTRFHEEATTQSTHSPVCVNKVQLSNGLSAGDIHSFIHSVLQRSSKVDIHVELVIEITTDKYRMSRDNTNNNYFINTIHTKDIRFIQGNEISS